MEQGCGYCGYFGKMVFVHSHYQCPRCGINIAPCCEGENCNMPETKHDDVLPENDPQINTK